jgi:cyclophilin family peptidyl-prolyl cis-trans isomerase
MFYKILLGLALAAVIGGGIYLVAADKEEIITEEKMENTNETTALVETNYGNFKIKFYPEDAPKTVANFINLAKKGFYDGLTFHRVIKDFMIQGGDPNGNGTGGPGYEFEDELNRDGYTKGTVAMANRGPNTNGSQFFIMVADVPLPNLYTIFGKVVEGQEVVDAISLVKTGLNDKPLESVDVKRITVL